MLPVSEKSAPFFPKLLNLYFVTKPNIWESINWEGDIWVYCRTAPVQRCSIGSKSAETLSRLCLLSWSCWTSISAVPSCEAVTLGANVLALSWGEPRPAICWLSWQSVCEGSKIASECLLSFCLSFFLPSCVPFLCLFLLHSFWCLGVSSLHLL